MHKEEDSLILLNIIVFSLSLGTQQTPISPPSSRTCRLMDNEGFFAVILMKTTLNYNYCIEKNKYKLFCKKPLYLEQLLL